MSEVEDQPKAETEPEQAPKTNSLIPDTQAIRESAPDEAQAFLNIGGINCIALNDDCYAGVRDFFGFNDRFAEKSFVFTQLKKSSGKGGDPMTRTNDGNFFIKQLNPGDHNVLKNPTFARDLCEHVSSLELPSLLGPIVCHFLNPETGFHYIALLNVLRHNGTYLKQYDLKGCADDRLLVQDGEALPVVRKRFYKPHIWLGCGGKQRRIYKNGKLEALHAPFLPLSTDQKKDVVEALMRDTDFLVANNLMDYSIIAGVVSVENPETEFEDLVPDMSCFAGKPLRCQSDEGETVLYLGIIDYLQCWNGAKVAANCIKFLERNKATVKPKKFGTRFATHFDHVLIAMDDENKDHQLKRRDMRKHPHRCFPFVRK